MAPTSERCDAFPYMSKGLEEVKDISLELSRGQQSLREIVIKLTENSNEMKRTNDRLEGLLVLQGQEIDKQKSFVNRAVGIMGALTFLVPTVLTILKLYFEKH